MTARCHCETCAIWNKAKVPTSREEAFLAAVLERVKEARAKYPGNSHRLAAVMEEAGECARALNKGEGQERLWEECVDLCATGLRLAIEGDAAFAKGGSK
jgi:hypothetical protein